MGHGEVLARTTFDEVLLATVEVEVEDLPLDDA